MSDESMRTTLIIPCYNEADRLDPAAFGALFAAPNIALLLVDDGSTDSTRGVLQTMARAHPDRVKVLALERNGGKGEAVRRGLLAAVAEGRTDVVGYLDADLATPPGEVVRLVELMQSTRTQVVLGAR